MLVIAGHGCSGVCCDKGCYLLTIRVPSERRFRPRPTPYSCEGSTCDAPLEVAAAAMRGKREQHPKKLSVAKYLLVEQWTLTQRIFPSCSKQQPSPPPPGRHPFYLHPRLAAAGGSQPQPTGTQRGLLHFHTVCVNQRLLAAAGFVTFVGSWCFF